MEFLDQPAPDDDSDIPDEVKAFLQLAAAVMPVLQDAHAKGKRLDVQADRQDIAVEAVKAVIDELQTRADQAQQRIVDSALE